MANALIAQINRLLKMVNALIAQRIPYSIHCLEFVKFVLLVPNSWVVNALKFAQLENNL